MATVGSRPAHSLTVLPTQLAVTVVSAFAAVLLGVLTVAAPVSVLVLLAACGGIALAWFTWHFPARALVTLVAALPFYQPISARLYMMGLPLNLLADARYWKEVVVLVLAAKLVASGFAPRDAVDWLAVVLLAIVAAYVLVPSAPGGPSLLERVLAARQDGAYVIVFLAARHLRLPDWVPRRVELAILAGGAVLSLFAFWNYQDPVGWTRWVGDMGFIRYQTLALKVASVPALSIGNLAGRQFIRAGSLFLSSLSLAHFLAIPVAIGIARAAQSRARRLEVFAGGLCVVALLLTLTRSMIATVPLMVAIVVLVARSRGRLLSTVIIAAVLIAPLAVSVDFGAKLGEAFNPRSHSTAGHVSALQSDIDYLFRVPLGAGLGTAGATTQRFQSGGITPESGIFQIGIELGFAGLVVFLALIGATLRQLARFARDGSPFATAAMAGLAALTVGAIVLHPFEDLFTSWSIWILAGLAIRQALPPVQAGDAPSPVARPTPATISMSG